MEPVLTTPRYDVTLEDADGHRTQQRVQVLNVDLVRYDRTAAKHGWPKGLDAPMLWVTFLAWSAMKREGLIDKDMTWETFEQRALQVQPAAEDELNGASPVDPTLAGIGLT